MSDIIFLAVLIFFGVPFLVAVYFWLRFFVAFWVVIVRRLMGKRGKNKDFVDEMSDWAMGDNN